MHTVYEPGSSGALTPAQNPEQISKSAVWIDLVNPTPDDEKRVAAAVGFEIPAREDLHEIEESSRLYQEDDIYVMTVSVLYQSDQPHPAITNVTFILKGDLLITIRYAEPRAFARFASRCEKPGARLTNGMSVLLGLVEMIVDRLADFVEHIQSEVDALSHSVFELKGGAASRQKHFDVLLRQIGREGEIASRARDSLASLTRAFTFLDQACVQRKEDESVTERLRIAVRDVQSIADHVGFQSSKITFLLNATLGMIQIEQNNIIKIFSVAAVVFLPPTLIASIYGMNFQVMPELGLPFGYPLAVALMIVSAILPYLYFKRKGWL